MVFLELNGSLWMLIPIAIVEKLDGGTSLVKATTGF